MASKKKEVRTKHGMAYFPLSTYDKLQKRAERNVHSISTEIFAIVEEALKRDEEADSQQQLQTAH